MSVFYQEEPSNSPKRCKCLLASTMKDAFAKCQSSRRKHSVSSSSTETDEPSFDFDEKEELFVSEIISKYMELKYKRKSTFGVDGFYQAPFPTPDLAEEKQGNNGVEDGDIYFSIYSSKHSRCSSDTTFDAFVSANTHFSRCSSLNNIDFHSFGKQSVIMKFSHCEGWPFGLCRKAFLPPLPKSPPNSWSWKKGGRMRKIHE